MRTYRFCHRLFTNVFYSVDAATFEEAVGYIWGRDGVPPADLWFMGSYKA